MDAELIALYGDQVYEKVIGCRVLVVGAGGIGCELLKTLALSGFRRITTVDLDTIEVSNLNRQFLFRRHHVGQAKALVAKEAILEMLPGEPLQIEAIQGNIKDRAKFPLSWWRSFDIFCSALDNADARSYLSSMALITGKAVIESGTAGHLGQSTVCLPGGHTECFDCKPRSNQKTYPVCTIRTTPSVMIHCIIWAKEFLLANLFGAFQEAIVPEEETSSEEVKANLVYESRGFAAIKVLGMDEIPCAVLTKCFRNDLLALAAVEELWRDRCSPQPLTCEEITNENEVQFGDMEKVNVSSWIWLFKRACRRLTMRQDPAIFFDKDDDDMMDFVAAAANIRAACFSIPTDSRFELKALAGNIIPAIAATNAVAAALVTGNVIRWLTMPMIKDSFQTTYIVYGANRPRLLTREELSGPSPDCASCNVHRMLIQCSVESVSLGQLREFVLSNISLDEENDDEEMSIMDGSRLLWDIDFDGNANRTLKDLGVGDSSVLHFLQSSGIPIVVALEANVDLRCTSVSILPTMLVKARQAALLPVANSNKRARDEISDSDEDIIMIESKAIKPAC